MQSGSLVTPLILLRPMALVASVALSALAGKNGRYGKDSTAPDSSEEWLRGHAKTPR